MNETAPDLDQDDRQPKFSDHFKYVSVLGNGAFGTVVAAQDKKHGNKLCAVKV